MDHVITVGFVLGWLLSIIGIVGIGLGLLGYLAEANTPIPDSAAGKWIALLFFGGVALIAWGITLL